MSEHEQSPSRPPAEEPEEEAAERQSQAEDPISPVRGFTDLDEAEAQAEEAEED
jgi:hypothetical protein